MAYQRDDIRLEVRDYLSEATEIPAGIWTDAQLNRFIAAEIRSLHRKGLYIREKDTTNTVVDQYDYTFPDNCYKVDKIERNWGTSDKPLWEEEKGWTQDDNAFYLGVRPTIVWQMRITFRKKFTVLTDDTTNSDIPDDKIDVVVVGATLRALHKLAAYLTQVANWDSISKPDGVTVNTVTNFIIIVQKEYKDLVQQFRTTPPAKEINLVG